MKLDLGAGGRPREGFTGVDLTSLNGGIAFDLVSGQEWPWATGSIEELASSHFIEHIPAANVKPLSKAWREADAFVYDIVQPKDALLFFFDEAFRVIRPGGLFHLTWPALKSSDAFRDPTHRRFIPLEMLHYLSREGRQVMGLEHYGATCNWVTVEGGVSLTLDPGRPDAPLTGNPIVPHNHLWDVQKAFSVVLRADK